MIFSNRDYFGHFIDLPHSLIAKIVGAYSIQIGRQKKVICAFGILSFNFIVSSLLKIHFFDEVLKHLGIGRQLNVLINFTRSGIPGKF